MATGSKALRNITLTLIGLLLCSSSQQPATFLTQRPPKQGIQRWHDEFSGAAGTPPNSRIWTAELGGGGWGNHEVETYTDSPSNVALDGRGHLRITARRDGGRWTSARLMTRGKRLALYGSIEVRAKLPSGKGLWPAAWTLGENQPQVGWPTCGEMDLFESSGESNDYSSTLHGPAGGQRAWDVAEHFTASESVSNAFHTYGVRWTKEQVAFTFDGRVVGVVGRTDVPTGGQWPFTRPQYVLLNLAVGGDSPGPPDAQTPNEASMVIDWVRVSA